MLIIDLVSAASEVGQHLLVTVRGHGLIDAVEVDGQRLVEVAVVEISVPLEHVTGSEDGTLGVARGHERKVVEVLGDGVALDGAAFVGQVAESSGNAGSLSC